MSAFALDLDGTLVDCRARQVAVARELEIDGFDEDAFWELKRDGATTRMALLELGVPEEMAARSAEEWARRVEEPGYLELDQLLPDAMAALDLITSAGHTPLILTARRYAERVRGELVGLGVRGEVLVVDPSRAADEKARVLADIDAVAFVGDTESDAAAAAAAGVEFAAVGTGQRSPEFLLRHGLPSVHGTLVDAVRDLLGR